MAEEDSGFAAASAGTADVAEREPEEATCGNCGLWGPNFYQRYRGLPVNTTCAADVAMDLPASFIPNRQTMKAHEGAGCICWRALASPSPSKES